MRRLLVLAPVVALSSFALACSIDEGGLAGDGGLDAPGFDAPSDSPIDVPEEPFVCPSTGTPSCEDAAVAIDRQPALFSLDAGAACPSGYTAHDLEYGQHAPTCSCTCNDAGPPACDTSTVHLHQGLTDCKLTSSSFSTSCNDGITAGSAPGAMIEADPPAVVGGCGGGTSVAPAIASTNVRLCVPDCATDERVCHAQGGLDACLYVQGNVPSCPTGYTHGPYFVGDAPLVQCDPCACSPTGDCTMSTLHLYGTVDCTGLSDDVPMNGSCQMSGAFAAFSAKIDGNLKPNTFQCNVSPGAAHTEYGSDEYTVCCP